MSRGNADAIEYDPTMFVRDSIKAFFIPSGSLGGRCPGSYPLPSNVESVVIPLLAVTDFIVAPSR